MSRAPHRRLVAAAITAASLALVATPAADAAKKKPVSKVDKKQNATIKKQGTAIKKVTKTAKSADKSAKSAGKSAAKGIADAKTATGKADAAQGTANAILGQVPSVLDGLTKLAAGLQQAADGLTKLAANAAAQEYGVVKVQVGGTDVPGAILTSGDIPDDANSAIVSGTMIVPVPAGATAAPIRLLAGVRSGESDGTGTGDPVASAGIVTMSVASAAPAGIVIGGGNTGLGTPQAPLTSAPNAAAAGAPVYPIPNKAPRVDADPNPFTFPSDLAIDLTDASTLYNLSGAGVGPFTVTNAAGSALPITVTVTVRFNDLTASATNVTA
jgi:X-X-X-Leu-X-X-Gly heptad repeat protein